MRQDRHRSVPSRTSPSANTPSSNDPAIFSTAISLSSAAATARSSKLVAQAEALANMTFELNLRAVCGRAERLDREVRALQANVEQDKKFRHDNEQRINDILKEIQSVRVHMERVQGGHENIENGLERQEREMAEVMGKFRDEVVNMRRLMDDIASRLDQCPTWEDVKDEIEYSSKMSHIETKALCQANKRFGNQQINLKNNTTADIKSRIQEAINSTRRWNRDHKTSQSPDTHFAANYLRKQSQRDPPMAVFLQRSLQRRIRERDTLTPGRTWSQPQSLEELCRHVSWKDVTDMVKDVLVVNEQRTVRSLKRAAIY